VVVLALALAMGGCTLDDIPNYTSPSAELLRDNPNASVIGLMSTGLFRGIRSTHEGLDTYGRDAYNLDPTEVRSVTVPLIGPIQDGGYWSYGDIGNCYAILNALDQVAVGMTDAEKAGIRGFVKTMMAYHFHSILRVRYQDGAFIDVDRPRDGPLAPHASGKQVLDHIIQLLEEAKTDLNAAGGAFMSGLGFPRGFQASQGGFAFNTPQGFLRFNRALKARVEAYGATWDTPNANAHWTEALAALSESFISPATVQPTGTVVSLATLNIGPKHTYGPATADGFNGVYDPTGRQRFVHPSLVANAENQPGGSPDDRLTRKIIDMGSFKGILGLQSRWRWNLSNISGATGTFTNDAPTPIIRNEELILIRAEANLGLGNTPDAIRDINLVRINSGQLAPIGDPFVPTAAAPTLLDQLLYERRYSLVYEFGHRWVDVRRYDKLATLPKDDPTHRLWQRLPFSLSECNFRQAENLSGCAQEGGI
jgi:hypothetical protein